MTLMLKEGGELCEMGCQGRPPGGGGPDCGLEDGGGKPSEHSGQGPGVKPVGTWGGTLSSLGLAVTLDAVTLLQPLLLQPLRPD